MPEVAKRIDAPFSLMNDEEGLLSCDRLGALISVALRAENERGRSA